MLMIGGYFMKKDYKAQHKELVTDINRNYYFNEWGYITHKSINYIPKSIRKLHRKYEELYFYIDSYTDEQKKQQIKELKKVRRQLKRMYKKLRKEVKSNAFEES